MVEEVISIAGEYYICCITTASFFLLNFGTQKMSTLLSRDSFSIFYVIQARYVELG